MTKPSNATRHEVSRLEGFSDAVFGFAITLLVVSLEVPKTFAELVEVMRSFPAFAISFALLFQIWWRHYRFFRRYGLEDSRVIALTGALLFVVLFFVYPLKFLWWMLIGQISGAHFAEEPIAIAQVPTLFFVYGAGVAATFGVLAALYRHAYNQRAALGLAPLEILEARVDVYRNVALAGVGLLSIALAAVLGAVAPRMIGIAGFVYATIGISEWRLGAYAARERNKLERAAAAPPPLPE